MKQVFEIVPPSGSAFAVLAAIVVLVMVGSAALVVYLIYSSAHVRVEVSTDGVRIRGGLYGRSIPMRDVLVEQARVINLEADPDHAFTWKTSGINMPGYRAGWFKLRNGEKALAFVSDRRQVVLLPTRQRYVALLSVASPDEFLGTLRAAAR